MESHRAQVVAKLAGLQESLEIIEHKIDIDCGRFVACWSSAPSGSARCVTATCCLPCAVLSHASEPGPAMELAVKPRS
jgi:hypothetical protein